MMFQADDPKTWANLIVGFLLLALGLVPLLFQWGFIAFTLPAFLVGIIGKVALWIMAAVGIWLIIDGFMEDDTIRTVTIILAILFMAIGIIQLLSNFGILGFSIPFLSLTIYYVIFAVEGLFLIIGAFATF